MLLIVEDEPQVARVLARFFEARFPVAIVGSAREAQLLIEAGTSLVGAVVDAGLPEGQSAGLELTRELRVSMPDLPIALISGRVDRDLINSAGRLSATPLCKPIEKADVEVFIDRIEARAPITALAEKYDLTQRETELLHFIAEGGDVADFLTAKGITRSTFNTHAASICRKTGARTVTKLALTALGDAARRHHR